jgi:hypothetical protein
MPASYPSSAKSFTSKNTGDTVQAAHINDLQLEVAAVEADLIAGLPVARGGTGLNTFTIGDLLYADGTGSLAQLADPATGQVLASGGVGAAPAYTASPTLTAVTAGTVTSTGQVVISGAAAGQIVFPASQNASTNVNTLDDYEEGTWTPVIGGSGGTSGQAYTYQVGRYVKVGKLVFASFNVLLSTLGTVTTNAQIQGFQFAAENTTNQNACVVITTWQGMTASIVHISAEMVPGATAATLQYTGAAATGSTATMAQGDLSNTTRLQGFVMYTAAA